MAKLYKNVSGTWKPIKKVYRNVSGVWKEAKKVYKNVSGTWREVHSGATEYTFTSSITSTSTTGILLSSYINPASSDEFIITINSGVTLRGRAGNNGGNGANGNRYSKYSNCRGANFGHGRNAGNGGIGYPAINFSGFSGKKITLIVNGSIVGGNGGNGGRGGNGDTGTKTNGFTCSRWTSYGGCGGTGGAGGAWYYGNSGVTIVGSGTSGSKGANGSSGTNGYVKDNCESCFTAGQKVLMADGSFKKIEDVAIGDKVQGAYGNINTVKYLDRPKLGNRKLFNIDGLITTDEHGVLNGKRNGFLYISLETGFAEYGSTQKVINEYGEEIDYLFVGLTNTKREQLEIGSSIATLDNERKVKSIESFEDDIDTQLYHLITDGDMTYNVSDVFVSSMANDSIFDYTNGKFL